FAQSAFGNVTSQAYGGGFGVTVWQPLQVFVEVGQGRDVASSTLGDHAAQIAAPPTVLQPGRGSYTAKQPVAFFLAGVRYPIVIQGSKVRPYVQGGFGLGNVKNDVNFQLTSGDVSQYVTLGSDLTGSATSPMLSLGGGVVVPVWQRLIADLQFRYGRIFADNEGINVSRAGVGVGVRF